MFVFYAESRDLLQPETTDNLRTYDAELSLIELRDEIAGLSDSPEEAAQRICGDLRPTGSDWTPSSILSTAARRTLASRRMTVGSSIRTNASF